MATTKPQPAPAKTPRAVQRRIEVYGPDHRGRYSIETVDDKTNKVLASHECDYAHQRSAIKAAQREVDLYKTGAAILVIVDAA